MPLFPADTRLSAKDLALGPKELEVLLRHWQAYRAVLVCVGLRRDSRLVDAALRVGGTSPQLLKNHEQVKAQVEKIYLRAQREHPNLEVRVARIMRDAVQDCDAVSFVSVVDGDEVETLLDVGFLSGPEWHALTGLHIPADDLDDPPFTLAYAGTSNEYASVTDVLRALERRIEPKEDPRQALPVLAAANVVPKFEWEESIDDVGARRVFVHLAQHAAVTEAEVATLTGSPRAARQFALSFEAHAAKVPFPVRIESADDVKRYVKEGEK